MFQIEKKHAPWYSSLNVQSSSKYKTVMLSLKNITFKQPRKSWKILLKMLHVLFISSMSTMFHNIDKKFKIAKVLKSFNMVYTTHLKLVLPTIFQKSIKWMSIGWFDHKWGVWSRRHILCVHCNWFKLCLML